MSENVFFKISNLKAEKSTHRTIVPSTESIFSLNSHNADIESLLLSSKNIK